MYGYFVTRFLKSKSNLADSLKYSDDQSFWMEYSYRTEVGREGAPTPSDTKCQPL